MNIHPNIKEILSLISQPAFYVISGTIKACNDSAERLLFQPELPISGLLYPDPQEYASFQNGCLFLTLYHNSVRFSASVTRTDSGDIFILDPDEQRKELNTLTLTAATMRQPLSAMIATAGNLFPMIESNGDAKTREQLNQMSRSLFQMHRMLCNMSDAAKYADGSSNQIMSQNIVSVVEGIFQNAQILAEHCGIVLEYSVPKEAVLCAIDEQLLERGIYNMLSNAMKFSGTQKRVYASLTRREKTMYISIQDDGPGIPPQLLSSIFHRYRRQPGIEDGRFGLGLGLVMVRTAASVHGGTVLIDQPGKSGTRITMSIPIRPNTNTWLRSDIISVDYAGGWDHGLLELSDVLPAHLYQYETS